MSDDLPPLGDSGINLPYAANPEPVETEVRALQCGGLVLAEGIAIFRDLATDGTAMVPVDALGSVTRLGPCSLLAYHRARGAV